jgi:hypothetical protein
VGSVQEPEHTVVLVAASDTREADRRAGRAGRAGPLLPAGLAGHDTGGLLAVADNMPRVRITPADFAHSADARSGLATATFIPNPSDPTNALLTIAYADGARDRLGLQNLIAMGGPSIWRMTIGTDVNPGPPGPAPATAGP